MNIKARFTLLGGLVATSAYMLLSGWSLLALLLALFTCFWIAGGFRNRRLNIVLGSFVAGFFIIAVIVNAIYFLIYFL